MITKSIKGLCGGPIQVLSLNFQTVYLDRASVFMYLTNTKLYIHQLSSPSLSTTHILAAFPCRSLSQSYVTTQPTDSAVSTLHTCLWVTTTSETHRHHHSKQPMQPAYFSWPMHQQQTACQPMDTCCPCNMCNCGTALLGKLPSLTSTITLHLNPITTFQTLYLNTSLQDVTESHKWCNH